MTTKDWRMLAIWGGIGFGMICGPLLSIALNLGAIVRILKAWAR